MNILFLEDQGVVFEYLIEELEEEGHSIFRAENIPKAIYCWRHETIDCIVADLNMPPDGLTDKQRAETHGSLLSGWIWLKYYVFEKKPSMKRQTILVTGYLGEFESIVAARERAGIRVVQKGPRKPDEDEKDDVLEHIREIEKELV